MEVPPLEKTKSKSNDDPEVEAEEDYGDDDKDEEDDEYDDDEVDDGRTMLEGVYDPSKYESLDVPAEIKNLFSFITYYTPQMIDIGLKLRPFIPDYVPAVGDVDAFIKIPYPDPEMKNTLGLTVLDEPNLNQTDSALLQLKLKAISKDIQTNHDQSGNTGSGNLLQDTVIRCGGSDKEIETWLDNIKNLHETVARPDSVSLLHNHQKQEIEALMEEWHEDIETALTVHPIPKPDLDCSLEEYVNIICAILDIPMQSNKISSLYLLVSLYNEFQNSQHFKNVV